jgi:pimeloyl-ACP methyl ester carboxylesterase
MLVDLVQTTTRDDIRLDGVYQAAATSTKSLPIDAFCLIHGTGSNFYSSSLLESIANRLVEFGAGVLRANTRGHDGISTAVTSRGGKRQGAAYEVVDDCRHDIAAWMAWLQERSGSRIGLIGHSLGAVKCLYALAHQPELAPACVVAISPPRLSYSWFCESANRTNFLEPIARAERLVVEGNPAGLMETTLPLPMLITAAGYLEKYGPEERYNLLKLLPTIRCPALFTFGELEVAGNMAFQGLPDAIASSKNANVAAQTVSAADHFYTGVRPELIARLVQWLEGLG